MTNNQNAKLIDPVALTQSILKAYENAAPIWEKAMKKASNDGMSSKNMDPLGIAPLTMQLTQRIAENPEKLVEMQTKYWGDMLKLWDSTAKKMRGEPEADIIQTAKGDRRFRDEDWQNNAILNFLKQSYLLTCNAVDDTIQSADGLEKSDRDKLAFTARLYADAMSPSNFAMTNPEVIRETLNTGGDNLVKGFENLIKDLKRGDGELNISATDYTAFKVGENVATTKGAVVFQNDLMQLIQYDATTPTVKKTPLLITPPWINKYYILDLKEENSFVKWATDQGQTVFMISWVNPDKRLSHKDFEDYMQDGILDAITAIMDITGEDQINAVGYCLGGTLLASTLAYLKTHGEDHKVKSATFLTTLLDFENAGDLKLFLGPDQIEDITKAMDETGLFEAKNLQQTFKLLRSNDLIWSFVINNYLLGREPFPFDLLYWNDDSTNMPAAMQKFYLNNMYGTNKLREPGGISLKDTPIDLRDITTPAYFLSTKEDHIAPWQATYEGTHLTSGETTFTLAASGHIAGIVNPPAKNKYCYWTADKPQKSADEWLETASQKDGSWWPHWNEWMAQYAGGEVAARTIEKSIEPAPGSYVKKNLV